MSALAGPSLLTVAAPVPPLAMKPTRVEARRRWSLAGLVNEGDVLVIQACARDYNDLPAFPAPGRSPVLELRVVSRPAVAAELDDAQAQLQAELLELRVMQAKAIAKVVGAEEHWRGTGKLRPEDVRELAEAEQLQKQIQARVGETPDEGIRGELRRMEQALQDNQLPPSATTERVKAMKEELDRLAREHLPEIEPRLTAARRDLADPPDAKPPMARTKGDLPQAREHQEEVKRSLDDLLRFLENWGDVQQVRGQLRELLNKQRALQRETQELELNTRDRDPKKPLTARDEAEVRRLASLQRFLAEDAQKLVEEMKRLAEQKAVQDGRAAEALQRAAKIADQEMLAQGIRDIGDQQIANRDKNNKLTPQLNRAAWQQDDAIKTMERMLEALTEGRDADLERLVRKQKDERKQLGDLGDKLEKLRKRAQAAQNIADRKLREAEMKKLAEEQRKLQEEAEHQARQLQRLQAPQAGKALDAAGEKMEGAARKLDQGEDPDEDMKAAEEKVREAEQRLQQAQDRAEEELAREQMARIADRLKGIRERQDAAIAETERLHKAMLRHTFWSLELLGSFGGHRQAQEGLAKETASLKEKLKGALVFEHMMDRTISAMERAAKRMQARNEEGKKWRAQRGQLEPLDKAALEAEEKAQAETLRLQREASARLERMMEAIKPEPGVAQRPKQKGGNQPKQKNGGPKEGPKQASRPPGDNVPPLAQLKALRAEQQDVNQRTRDFAERHPNAENLPADAQAELTTIRQDQERLSELFRQMQQAANAEGGNR
jgi:hypothetical protein